MASEFLRTEVENMSFTDAWNMKNAIEQSEEENTHPEEFDLPSMLGERDGDTEKEMHLRELRNLAQNMEDDEYKVLVDYIPIHFILERLNKELQDKAKIEQKINQIYEDISSRR